MTLNCCEYGVSLVPPGRAVVTICSPGEIVTANGRVAVAPAESMANIVKLEGPVPKGVPEITPVLPLRLRPAGRAPDATDHATGAVPPLLLTVCE